MDVPNRPPGGVSDLDSAMDALVAVSRARLPARLPPRDLAVSGTLAVVFLAAAVALAALAPDGGRAPGAIDIAAFVAAYAVCSRIEFEVSSGTGVPTMLVLVPMLFVLPPGWAPLVVAGGLVMGGAWDWARGLMHPERSLVLLASAWHALGPATALAVAGAPRARLGDAPLYAAALAAQLGCDFAATAARERVALGISPRLIGTALLRVWAIDLLLAPCGLAAALVAANHRYAWLLVLPVAVLLGDMARDRRARITEALRLAHAYRVVNRSAHSDPLTGIGNRLAWDEAVALADASGESPVSVIVADLDGLKRANDELGHEVGDALLCAAAETIRREVRESDVVARFGGDEFGVLLVGASEDRCRATVRRIERSVATHPAVGGMRLALSMGWAATPEAGTVAEAQRVADQRMYERKQTLAGRTARLGYSA